MKRFISFMVMVVFMTCMVGFAMGEHNLYGARLHYIVEPTVNEKLKKKIREAAGNERDEEVPEKK